MKVYIVCFNYPYEGMDILKVFAHKEEAVDYVTTTFKEEIVSKDESNAYINPWGSGDQQVSWFLGYDYITLDEREVE